MKRLALVLSLAACGDGGGNGGGTTVDRPAACNPLSDVACAYPFPSSAFLVDDAASATGVRVDIPAGALPANQEGNAIDPVLFNGHDGFSPNAHILAAFPGGVDPAALPTYADPARSLGADSPTVILDMESGERVLHFAELDMSDASVDEASKRALVIRPMVRLKGGTRYAVAIRRSLSSDAGEPLERPAGFAAALAGEATAHPLLPRVTTRTGEVVAALGDAGVPEADLLLAWDFVTASDARLRADLEDARDAMLAAMAGGAGGFGQVTVTGDVPFTDGVTKRRLDGTFTMPLFLTEEGDDGVMNRDVEGRPSVSGTYLAPFTAIVPACVDTAPKPVPILIYGHGLFGTAEGEVASGWLRNATQFLCVVAIGTDWRGMSTRDVAGALLTLSDFNRLPLMMDKLVLGVNAFIALARVAATTMVSAPEFQEGGVPLLDPARIYYYGNSQGGIFGGTFMAFDPTVQRGVLGVGAANYSLFLERSSNWPIYQAVLSGAYPDPLDRQLLVHLLQWAWDVGGDPVTGLPLLGQKQILMQAGIGDAQVNNLGTDFQARTVGIPVLEPAVYEPYGVTPMAGPLGSALNYFKGNAPPLPTGNTPAEDNEMHELVRRTRAANEQMKIFFETGEIVQTCKDGATPAPCDCSLDRCGGQL